MFAFLDADPRSRCQSILSDTPAEPEKVTVLFAPLHLSLEFPQTQCTETIIKVNII